MLQFGVAARNAWLASIEAAIGALPLLQLFAGSEPSDCSQPDPAGLLATIILPSDWLTAPAGGTVGQLGTWSANAIANGVAASFRIKDSTGTVVHMQGSVGQGTGDLSLQATNLLAGQLVTISVFNLTAGNA